MPNIEPVRFDISDLDPAADPRHDLDAYVNARWRRANPLPPDMSVWDCFTILGELSLQRQSEIAEAAMRGEFGDSDEQRIVADFWASGRDASADVEGTELLRREFARIEAVADAESIAAYLRDAHARGLDWLFWIEARPDFDDPKKTIIFAMPQRLGLPDRAAYLADSSLELLGHYTTHVTDMLELSGVSQSQARALADNIVSFERRLAAVSPSRHELARDVALLYYPSTVEAADNIAPTFCWSRFLDPAQGSFSLAVPEFHAEFERMLHSIPVEVWRATLRFRAASDAAPLLGGEWCERYEDFHGRVLRGRKAPLPAWKQTLRVLNTYAGDAMGALYARRYASRAAQARVHALFDNLKSAMHTRIHNLGWMTEPTREVALQKLSAMTAKIGAAEARCDWAGLSTQRGSLYANVLAARAFNRRRERRECMTPTDTAAWSLTPQTANARYEPQHNEIVIPAALLEPPLYSDGDDDALIYGGIGAVVAHEMTHAFDDQGSRFDAQGRFRNWWAKSDRERFDALSLRMAECAGQWTDLDGEHVDGRLTLGENIADFGGLALAADAFQRAIAEQPDINRTIEGFSSWQRFFFAWATLWRQVMTPAERSLRRRNDVHAPGNVRANAPAAYLDAYAKAFSCDAHDRMRRGEQGAAHIW